MNLKHHERENGAARRNLDWQALLEKHQSWLRTVVLARLRSSSVEGDAGSAVDDVMQEVALAAVRQQAPLDDSAKAAPWLYGLAVRQALLYRRKRGRQRNLAKQAAQRKRVDGVHGEGLDPLRWLLDEERREAVRRALGELPARDAEVLLLKYTENWKYQEIASHLGMSVSAVEARLFRARRKLRALLRLQEVVSAD